MFSSVRSFARALISLTLKRNNWTIHDDDGAMMVRYVLTFILGSGVTVEAGS